MLANKRSGLSYLKDDNHGEEEIDGRQDGRQVCALRTEDVKNGPLIAVLKHPQPVTCINKNKMSHMNNFGLDLLLTSVFASAIGFILNGFPLSVTPSGLLIWTSHD